MFRVITSSSLVKVCGYRPVQYCRSILSYFSIWFWGYRGGSHTAVQAWQPCPLWEPSCKNRLPYNLYCVGGDVKHCSLTHCGSHPLVTPYYCRLGDLLCFVFMSAYCMFALSVYCMYLCTIWYCWLSLLTSKNRLPYNLYCVGGT